MTAFQIFPALDPATEAALRASIQRFGVLVPVVVDQHGAILDGHHRARIAGELGVDYEANVRTVGDEDEAREIARTLNSDRRHLTIEQRRAVVTALREEGHSLRAIAGAVGVKSANTIRADLSPPNCATDAQLPDRVTGLDGKSRPARQPKPDPAPVRRGYRKNRGEPFEITSERQRLIANANKQRLIEGLSQINGLLRGLLDLDYGIVAAALNVDEARTWAGIADDHARSLKQLERKIKEAAANVG